jgi:flagellar basal body-associated protein FliL
MNQRTQLALATLAALLLALVASERAGYTDLLSGLHARPIVISGLGSDTAGLTVATDDDLDLETFPAIKEEFVICLRDPELELDRVLRVTVIIELFDLPARDELKAHLGQLRDAFLTRAASLDPQRLDGATGLEQGRNAMHAALKIASPTLRARGVYFTEFVLR